jgi:hypothetical protein
MTPLPLILCARASQTSPNPTLRNLASSQLIVVLDEFDNLKMAGREFMKFGMDIMPQVTTPSSHFLTSCIQQYQCDRCSKSPSGMTIKPSPDTLCMPLTVGIHLLISTEHNFYIQANINLTEVFNHLY